MPRQSTSASNRGTPRPALDASRPSRKSRGAAESAGPSSPDPIALSPVAGHAGGSRKRKRQEENVTLEIGHQENGTANTAAGTAVEEFTQEQQLEAWQEFAAEHYEMVEQLPLELHRNFRLLRELDDGCVAQTTKLQDQIRAYIAARMELVKRYAAVEKAMQGGEEEQAAGEAVEVDGEGQAAPNGVGAAGQESDPAEESMESQMEVDPQSEVTVQQEGAVVDANTKQPTPEPEVDAAAAPSGAAVAPEAEAAPETAASADPTPNSAAAAAAAKVTASEADPTPAPQIHAGSGDTAVEADPTPDPQPVATAGPSSAPMKPSLPSGTVPVPALTITPRTPPPMPGLPPDMGEPVPDGEGGLVVSSTKDDAAVAPAAGSSPAAVDKALRESPVSETQGEGGIAAETTADVTEAAEPEPKDAVAQVGAGPQGTADAAETADADPQSAASGGTDEAMEGVVESTHLPNGQSKTTVEEVSAQGPSEEGKEEAAKVAGEDATKEMPQGPAAEPAEPPAAPAMDIPMTATASSSRLDRSHLPARFLPEIGRLSREVVRNCEEKVALAHGAYNSIDRHIRALDSALSAQETSLILGLRPDTLPSTNVDQTLNLVGDASGIPQPVEDDEEGERNNKKKKGKKGQKRAASEEELQQQIVAEVVDGVPDLADADPNEPRYCYCNKVSWGTMIGCDNDSCPLEWFHISCTGLQAEPPGSWECNLCKPKVGLGMGGAGSVQPGGAEKRAVKRKKRF